MTEKITRIRLVVELDSNELPTEVFRAAYRVEDDAAPGVRTNAVGKGQLGPAATAVDPQQSADTIDWAGLSAESTPADMIAAIVAAAKTDSGI